MRWVAFTSGTGYEIFLLSRKLRRKPDFIVTDNVTEFNNAMLDWIVRVSVDVIVFKKRLCERDYCDLNLTGDDIITLHDYKGDIPRFLIEHGNVYAKYPGLITLYPDLRNGKPQKKSFDARLPYVGGVIYRVNLQGDMSMIVKAEKFKIRSNDNIRHYYYGSRIACVRCWGKFLKEKYYEYISRQSRCGKIDINETGSKIFS